MRLNFCLKIISDKENLINNYNNTSFAKERKREIRDGFLSGG